MVRPLFPCGYVLLALKERMWKLVTSAAFKKKNVEFFFVLLFTYLGALLCLHIKHE